MCEIICQGLNTSVLRHAYRFMSRTAIVMLLFYAHAQEHLPSWYYYQSILSTKLMLLAWQRHVFYNLVMFSK